MLHTIAIGFFLGALIGWLLPRSKMELFRLILKWVPSRKRRFNKNYFHALTSLLNEEPDVATATLISSFPVTDVTLDTHIALGVMYRKRGEFDRAVRVHENLCKNTALDSSQNSLVLAELAEDYYFAGLLDRAETLHNSLADDADLPRKSRQFSMRRLIDIYTQTREWLKGLSILDSLTFELSPAERHEWQTRQSHFACELADEALSNSSIETAEMYLAKARNYDAENPRPDLILLKIAIRENRVSDAMNLLLSIKSRAVSLLSDAFLLADEFLAAALNERDYLSYLQNFANGACPLVALGRLCALQSSVYGVKVAVETCCNGLEPYSVHRDYVRILRSTLPSDTEDPAVWDSLYRELIAVVQRVADSFLYRQCQHCGMRFKQMVWNCPACGTWDSVNLVQHSADFALKC